MTDLRLDSLVSRRGRVQSSVGWRIGLCFFVTLSALVLQVSVVPLLAPFGLMPNLVLLVVVAAALARGRDFAAVLGFALGLALDLSPAADQLAGRWALAFVVVGYVVGSTRRPGYRQDSSRLALLVTIGAASFVGTSIFALTGVVLSDPATPVPDVLQMIFASTLSDCLVGMLLLPWCIRLFARLQSQPAI
jgi:rod shape-determining protein MreD